MTAGAAADSALLLLGHGSARHPESAAPVLALAEAIRAENRFAQVSAAFMKQEPKLERALDGLKAERVVVVPVFAGKGYYTDQLIPGVMGLDAPITRLGRRVIHYTAPVGTHPRIPALMAARAAAVAGAEGLTPARVSLLLIAHGSGRPGGSGETPRAIAAAIARKGIFAEVALAFLEQEPFATGWPQMVTGAEIVALPLLVAQGMHASQDIPPLFGLQPGDTGPVTIHGRRVRLATGLGAEPELVRIVVEMAEAAVRI